jgi:hypothetical protein
MSKEQELSNAIDAYLAKSAMPFPKGQDRYGLPKKEDSMKPLRWDDVKSAARKASDKLGITKPEDEFKEIHKAKPKVLKPGSPEHTKVMAEMEATKAAKPKSTNPAGEESPSRPGSRDKLGDRPLVGGMDKQVLQTAAERAGAGLRGGQSAPAPTTPAPTPTTPAPKPAAPTPTTTPGFKPDERLRNMPPGGYGSGPLKSEMPKEPTPTPSRSPLQRVKDVGKNVQYATGLKDPAMQGTEERKRYGGKKKVRSDSIFHPSGRKTIRVQGQVPSPTGWIQDSADFIESLEKMGPFTKSVGLEDGSHSWDYQG